MIRREQPGLSAGAQRAERVPVDRGNAHFITAERHAQLELLHRPPVDAGHIAAETEAVSHIELIPAGNKAAEQAVPRLIQPER